MATCQLKTTLAQNPQCTSGTKKGIEMIVPEISLDLMKFHFYIEIQYLSLCEKSIRLETKKDPQLCFIGTD